MEIKDGMRIYDVNAAGDTVVSSILSAFGSVYYYARAVNTSDINLALPDLPSAPDAVYMLTVPTRCGAETFAVVSSSPTRVYVGVVPISERLRPIDANSLYCEHIARKLCPAMTVSELKSVEINGAIHYCYISTSLEMNTVLSRLGGSLDFVGVVGNAYVYRLEDNTMINILPGEPLGIIAYRYEKE